MDVKVFFDEIARNINTSCLNNLINNYNCQSTKYCFSVFPSKENNYSINSADEKLLIDSIVAVLSFNKSLSVAIEIFDGVDQLDDHMFDGEYVSCNNHISFASKFLHFYFPKLVFIVDNFAYNGGSLLFNGSEHETKRRYLNAPPTEKEYFAKDIYNKFSQKAVKKLIEKIVKEVEKSISLPESNADKKTNSGIEKDSQLEGKHYIDHCIRSYLMGCYLKKEEIHPINQIKHLSSIELSSMPRLTDAIFLNIKKALTPKEVAYQKSLEVTFYNKIKKNPRSHP